MTHRPIVSSERIFLKSNMTDVDRLENRRIAVSRQRFDGSSPNLPRWCIMSLWTTRDRTRYCFQDSLMCAKEPFILVAGAHWRLLIDAIEPSVCGGDAALCQITLTTYYCYFQKSVLLKPHKTYVVIVNRCY